MSGLVALINLDGSPVDEQLLRRMTAHLRFRGPDGAASRAAGSVGLGHALLHTASGTARPDQPFDWRGRHWIVADARIDAQEDLRAALTDALGEPCPAECSDVELIARAYAAWGEACVARLLGDYSFVLWDAIHRRLLCARDHMGVRPLYYAQAGATLIVSNTLDCVRLHPRVSSELDEAAVADFLLFGENRDGGTTTFRSIKRLPPAHVLTWSDGAVRQQRYWTLPIEDPLHFARGRDYLDRFIELLHSAVADRLRASRVTVLMSGGVDSSTLAAAALAVQRGRADCAVDAVTSTYGRLIDDRDRDFAGLVAERLTIPIRYDVRDDETSILDWDRIAVETPEPVANPPAFSAAVQFLRTTASGVRVLFYGEGPDNALRYEWRPYLSHLAGARQVSRLLRALASDALMHPRVPLWSSARQLAGASSHARRWQDAYPEWLDESFASRSQCRQRWESAQRPDSRPGHPVRPMGYAGLDAVRWQPLFEDCDVTGARAQAEFRYPFLDIRLLRYMLALPAMPWCRNKLIIRRAMHGQLPRAVLSRKKTPVPNTADFKRMSAHGLPRPSLSPALRQFVDPRRIPSRVDRECDLRSALRPLGLGYWLERCTTVANKESWNGIENAVPV